MHLLYITLHKKSFFLFIVIQYFYYIYAIIILNSFTWYKYAFTRSNFMGTFIRPFKAKVLFIFVSIFTIPSVIICLFFLFAKSYTARQFIPLFILALLLLIVFRASYKLYKRSYLSICSETVKISQISFASKKMKIPGKHFFLKTSCFVFEERNANLISFSNSLPEGASTSDLVLLRPLYLTSFDFSCAIETCWYTKAQIQYFLAQLKQEHSI